jgi:hypothetical protein
MIVESAYIGVSNPVRSSTRRTGRVVAYVQ